MGIVAPIVKRAPGALGQRVDDDDAEPGEGDDENEEEGDDGRDARAVVLISERAISASERPPRRVDAQSDDRIVHGAGEAAAGEQPDEARRPSKLRGQHGTDERSCARDRREVMTEEHPPTASDSSSSRRISSAPASSACRRAPSPWRP